MSAYMVSKATIDYLVTAGLVLPRRNMQGGVLRWFDERPPEDAFVEGVAIPGQSIEWAQAHRRELTHHTAGRVGAMLLAENRRSVSHRYAEDEVDPIEAYEFAEVEGRLVAGVVKPISALTTLALLSHYNYQACEHPTWPYSEAWFFCEALRHTAIGALPGRRDEPWGVDADELRYQRGIRLGQIGGW